MAVRTMCTLCILTPRTCRAEIMSFRIREYKNVDEFGDPLTKHYRSSNEMSWVMKVNQSDSFPTFHLHFKAIDCDIVVYFHDVITSTERLDEIMHRHQAIKNTVTDDLYATYERALLSAQRLCSIVILFKGDIAVLNSFPHLLLVATGRLIGGEYQMQKINPDCHSNVFWPQDKTLSCYNESDLSLILPRAEINELGLKIARFKALACASAKFAKVFLFHLS